MTEKKKAPVGQRKCTNCHRLRPTKDFKKSLYCKYCVSAMKEVADQMAEEKTGLISGGLVDSMVRTLESSDPLAPQLLEGFLELYGGIEQLRMSLYVTVAQLEGRWADGKVVSWEEANRRGLGVIKGARAQLLYRYHKLLTDVMLKIDEQRAAANPFQGLTPADMMAAMRKGMLNQMSTDEEYRLSVMRMIKRRPEWMAEFMEVSTIIPAQAEPAEVAG